MFYPLQSNEQREKYKNMLSFVGRLSLLFSESNCPFLHYRAHENIFCKYFDAENLARHDCSADAKKDRIGIGLKTWMGNDDQKVAEFGRQRELYQTLSGIDLVKKIAEFRNERIRITKNLYGIDEMIYHIIRRIPGSMQIIEYALDSINIERISLIPERSSFNNTYFTDEIHTYHFSASKNTLYMIFSGLVTIDNIEVEIMLDPYQYLADMIPAMDIDVYTPVPLVPPAVPIVTEPRICLRLYSTRADGSKYVYERSGLNQWNALGRPRNPNEVYIPYPAEDRQRSLGFFPPRDTVFSLTLPDATVIPAKVCQACGKAIMSNPNRILGRWLLRNVFEIPEGTLITYEMLERYNVDSVVFTKHSALDFSIDFAEIGTYEEFNGIDYVE